MKDPANFDAITFRPYLPSDEPFIQQLYATSREAEMALVDWTAEQKTAFLNMQCTAQLHHYQLHYHHATHQIILYHGEPIGRIYVNRPPAEIRLMDITLLPDYRNHGIGTYIMQNLLAEADQSNRPVTLHVETINPDAYRLYQHLGFQPVSQNGIHMFMERLPAPLKTEGGSR